MKRRALRGCALVWCCLLPGLAQAQKKSPAVPGTSSTYVHAEEQGISAVPPKAIDDALADLAKEAADIQLKTGPLDVKALEKALREQLPNATPPRTLKVLTSGSGRVVDPKDTGLYWAGLQISFGGGNGQQYVWDKRLAVDEKQYGLSVPPLYEVKYELASQWQENSSSQPFGRTMRLHAHYRIVAKFTLTFAPAATANGLGTTRSGSGGATPTDHTLSGEVSVADREKQ